MQSLEDAEKRAKSILDGRISGIMAKNQNRRERHAKSLERISSVKDQKLKSLEMDMQLRMDMFDHWKARKLKDYEDTMKKAKKASELRQIIM